MQNNISFATDQLVEVWWSSKKNPRDKAWYQGPMDIKFKLDKQPDLKIINPNGISEITINIDSEVTYQTVQGIGASLEESTIYNLSRMSALRRKEVLKALVDQINGIGINLMRICFGSSDFTGHKWYSYDDMLKEEEDPNLDYFSIQKDIYYNIISVVNEALSYNPKLKFIAAPWSPPDWLKINSKNLCGGYINPTYFNIIAQYYCKAIKEYELNGIPIYAFSLQNEPEVNRPDMPSCFFTWQNEGDFIKIIKEEFGKNNINTKLWILDHNFGIAIRFAGRILADAEAGIVTDGIAFHDYAGELDEMTKLHNMYPTKELFLTECSVWGTNGMDRIIQYFRNWACTYNSWVTMLDSNRLPNNGPFDADPILVIQDASNFDNYWFIPEYYMIGQFSKFIQYGAKRIKSNNGSKFTITNVTFMNPDNTIILIVVNQTSLSKKFKILKKGKQITATIPGKTVATYKWLD